MLQGQENRVLVRAEEIVRVFGTGTAAVRAVDGVSLTVERGNLTVLRGRSGSGKTTLLNLIGGLDRPTSGRIYLGELALHELPEGALTLVRRRRIGYVFQSFALLPLLSARENVELALRTGGVPAPQRRERATRWLEYVGLKDRMEHRPYELSGGEQQRAALARALAAEPELILADEPTGELDSRTARQIIDLFCAAAVRTGAAICLTTHDPAIAEAADVVYTLVDGRLEMEG